MAKNACHHGLAWIGMIHHDVLRNFMVKMNETPEGRHGGHSGEFLDLAGMNILYKIETNMDKNTIL